MLKQVYHSDILKKYFDTEEEAVKAEQEYNEKHALEIKAKEEKAKEAKKVEELLREANEKTNEAYEALNAFTKKYGSFHTTYSGKSVPTNTLLDLFFKDFWF